MNENLVSNNRPLLQDHLQFYNSVVNHSSFHSAPNLNAIKKLFTALRVEWTRGTDLLAYSDTFPMSNLGFLLNKYMYVYSDTVRTLPLSLFAIRPVVS